MTLYLFVTGVLLLLVIFQHVYYSRQIQKLIDKIMAGSYQGYVQATKERPIQIKLEDAPPEDLSVLNDFS